MSYKVIKELNSISEIEFLRPGYMVIVNGGVYKFNRRIVELDSVSLEFSKSLGDFTSDLLIVALRDMELGVVGGIKAIQISRTFYKEDNR